MREKKTPRFPFIMIEYRGEGGKTHRASTEHQTTENDKQSNEVLNFDSKVKKKEKFVEIQFY